MSKSDLERDRHLLSGESNNEIQHLRKLLYTDDLTGLFNRRFFRHCISEQKAQCDSTRTHFVLFMMDIDHFKEINDTMGHAAGDQALIQVSRALDEEIRPHGWVFRYAGDEFVAILPDVPLRTTERICERLLHRISSIQMDAMEGSVSLSISIGFALYPHDSKSISGLLEASDQALYASKKAGRNSYHSAKQLSETPGEAAPGWPVRVESHFLIGRNEPFRILEQLLQESKQRASRLVVVSGEAGIGKSRLLRQFLRRLRVSDHYMLIGECSEETIVHSYAPVREAIKNGFEARDPATTGIYRQLNDTYRRELVSLVPDLSRFENTPLRGTSSDRYLLLESVSLLLKGLSRQLPVVIALEDVQWSDHATLQLIPFLARNLRNERVLMILTFREEEAIQTGLSAFLQNLSRETSCEFLSLTPLTQEQTADMSRDIFRGFTVPAELEKWIFQETEGIPFYIEEFIKLLSEEGYIRREDRRLILKSPEKSVLPYSVRTLISRRIQRLEEPLQKVLTCAALVGYEFDLSVVTRLMDRNESFVLDLLEHAMKLQLIREVPEPGEDRFVFRHKKIRSVIYEDVSVIKRRKIHQQIGEILESFGPEYCRSHAEDLAYHFENSGDLLRVWKYSLEAGRKAKEIHAYGNAMMHFQRCLSYRNVIQEEISPIPVDQQEELFLQMGGTLEILERWEEAVQSYEHLFALTGGKNAFTRDVDALIHLSSLFYRKENFPKALLLARQGWEIAKEGNYPEGVCDCAEALARTLQRTGDYSTALEYTKTAIPIAEELGKEAVLARLWSRTGRLMLGQNLFSPALHAFQKARDLFESQNDKKETVRCLVQLSKVCEKQGNLHEARQHVINAFALAQETGDPLSIARCAASQAGLEFQFSNFELGSRMNQRAETILQRHHHLSGMIQYYQNEAWRLALTGELKRALEALHKGQLLSEKHHLPVFRPALALMKARILYFLGSYSSSVQTLDSLIQEERPSTDENTRTAALLDLGFIYLALSDTPRVQEMWTPVLERKDQHLDAWTVFWRIAASSIMAARENRAKDAYSLRQELRMFAQRMDHPFLIVASILLSSTQCEYLKQWKNAEKLAKEADHLARQYGHKIWIPGAEILLFEMMFQNSHFPPVESVERVLESAATQGQQHVVHRCYQLLWNLKPESSEVHAGWLAHWNSWKPELPVEYQKQVTPAFESLE